MAFDMSSPSVLFEGGNEFGVNRTSSALSVDSNASLASEQSTRTQAKSTCSSSVASNDSDGKTFRVLAEEEIPSEHKTRFIEARTQFGIALKAFNTKHNSQEDGALRMTVPNNDADKYTLKVHCNICGGYQGYGDRKDYYFFSVHCRQRVKHKKMYADKYGAFYNMETTPSKALSDQLERTSGLGVLFSVESSEQTGVETAWLKCTCGKEIGMGPNQTAKQKCQKAVQHAKACNGVKKKTRKNNKRKREAKTLGPMTGTLSLTHSHTHIHTHIHTQEPKTH